MIKTLKLLAQTWIWVWVVCIQPNKKLIFWSTFIYLIILAYSNFIAYIGNFIY